MKLKDLIPYIPAALIAIKELGSSIPLYMGTSSLYPEELGERPVEVMDPQVHPHFKSVALLVIFIRKAT